MRFLNNVVIDRPRAEVFDFLADLENIPRWNYAIVETRNISGGAAGVGARFRQVRSLPTRSEEIVEITELEPDRHLAMRGDIGP
jgi:uncharacterized protein YndB with AHSA1/START domain